MLEREMLLGWATDDLAVLDPLAPGLIARVLTSSPKARQAIFSVLAARYLAARDRSGIAGVQVADDANLAFILCEGRPREVLQLAFGHVPDGWLGALERLGGRLLTDAMSYERLRAVFFDPKRRGEAVTMRHVGPITENLIRVAATLDRRWLHSEALGRLPTPAAAYDFNHAIAFAQAVCSRATDEAVVAAIARLPPCASLSVVVTRFVRRADRFPEHPIALDEEMRPLNSVRDFVDAARRYRNCLVSEKLDEALAGQVAFAEFRATCIVEFRPLTLGRGWLLHDVHVARNGFVNSELAEAARSKCTALGIPSMEQRDKGESWRRYRRFVRDGV